MGPRHYCHELRERGTGYLIFYGGARKLERVLRIMESVDPSLHDDWACLVRLGFAASEAGDRNRGRVLVERALRQRPQAPYVIHAYAHVLHDQGGSTPMSPNY